MSLESYQAPRFPATNLPLPSGHRHKLLSKDSVAWALYSERSPIKALKRPGSNSASQKAGKRYEARVLKALSIIPNGRAVLSPWIQYGLTSGHESYCQPDALLFRKNYLIIFEIKLTHTIDAYWQLRHLYLPIMKRLELNIPIVLVEITRSFDPSYLYPEEMVLYFQLVDLLRDLDNTIGGRYSEDGSRLFVPQESTNINILQWKL